MPSDNAKNFHPPDQMILPDGVDIALGLALRQRRQADVYRKLAEVCERQAEEWERLAERLRQGQPVDGGRTEPGQWPRTGQFRGPGGS